MEKKRWWTLETKSGGSSVSGNSKTSSKYVVRYRGPWLPRMQSGTEPTPSTHSGETPVREASLISWNDIDPRDFQHGHATLSGGLMMAEISYELVSPEFTYLGIASLLQKDDSFNDSLNDTL